MSTKEILTSEIALFENILAFNTRIDLLNSFLDKIPEFIRQKSFELSEEVDITKFGIHAQIGRSEAISNFMFEFENTLLKSFIVTLVIFLESELGIFCDEIKKELNRQDTWNDIRGTPLERLIEYTTKKIGMKLTIPEELWKKVNYIISLRHCIVSFSGKITNFSDRKKILNFAQQTSGLAVRDESVFLSKDTCKDCVEIIKKFLENLYNDAIRFSL